MNKSTDFDKKQVYSWAFYDWANSAFATTIMAAVLPVYFSKVAAETLDPTIASSYWGYANTLAMISIAVLAPVLGAMADYKNAKLKFLGSFATLGIVFSGMLFLIKSGDWLEALVFFIIARIGFSAANVFYDSLLPHLANRTNIDRISTIGYAMGYMGGGILLAINMVMILQPAYFFLSSSAIGTRVSFLTVAVWWALFSIPLFKNVKEPVLYAKATESGPLLTAGFRRLYSTFKKLKSFKQAFRFLLAFWFYNDGIGTIIVMAVIFGSEIGIGQEHLIGAILAVQFVGIPFTILFGKLAKRITAKRAIFGGLIVYTCIAIGGYFMQNALHFWILAIFVGMVQGGTQALSRSFFGLMTPKQKSAEFFGFFDLSQKFSGILGPALFGIVGQLSGSSRSGIIALVIFFIGGMYLLEKVRLSEGIAEAQKEDARASSETSFYQ